MTPELTDEWVQENSEESETVDEYQGRESVHSSRTIQQASCGQSELESSVQSALMDKVEVKAYPQEQSRRAGTADDGLLHTACIHVWRSNWANFFRHICR